MLTTPDDGNGSCPTCGQPTSLSASPPPPATDGALESEGLVQANVQGNGSVTYSKEQVAAVGKAIRHEAYFEYGIQLDEWMVADLAHEAIQAYLRTVPPTPAFDDRTSASEAQSGSLNQTLPASLVSATDAVEAERVRLDEAEVALVGLVYARNGISTDDPDVEKFCDDRGGRDDTVNRCCTAGLIKQIGDGDSDNFSLVPWWWPYASATQARDVRDGFARARGTENGEQS